MAFPKKKSSGLSILNQAADVVESKYAKKPKKPVDPDMDGDNDAPDAGSENPDALSDSVDAKKKKSKLAGILKAKGK